MPVASCSLSEPELACLGPAADSHITSSVYSSSVASASNASFIGAWQRRLPELGPTLADAEASHVAVHLLARAISAAGSAAFDPVRRALADVSFEAPQGMVRIDAENRRAFLRPRIGLSHADRTFRIVGQYPSEVRPDPYLVREPAHSAPPGARNQS